MTNIMLNEHVQETIADCKASGDPHFIRTLFDDAFAAYADDEKVDFLSTLVREMLVMNFSADISAVYEVLGANRVVSPNGSAAKKATIPVSTQSNTPASKTSMLGTISLPRVVDDAASKGSGSDIPSHSSASSQDELPNEDPLVTEQLWQVALSRDHESKLFSTHQDFFDSLLKDIGTGRGSSVDWADVVDELQTGEEEVDDPDEPVLQTAAITSCTPVETPAKPSQGEAALVAPWDIPQSPMETLFRRGYGGLGQSELKDVIDQLGDEDDHALLVKALERGGEDGDGEGGYVTVDDLPVIAAETDSKPAAFVDKKPKKQKKQQLAGAASGPVVVDYGVTTASLDESSLPLELLSPAPAAVTTSNATANKAKSSTTSGNNANSKKGKLPANTKKSVATVVLPTAASTAEAVESILNDHNNDDDNTKDEEKGGIVDLIMRTATKAKEEEEEEADIHHRLGIVRRLKGQANAILNHLNLNKSRSQDDYQPLTASDSLNAMLKQSFEAHVKAYTQPPSTSSAVVTGQPLVSYDYAQDAVEKEDEDDSSYDTQTYHELTTKQQQQQQQTQQEVDVKPAVITVKVSTKNKNGSSRRNSDLGPDNKPIRLKDATTASSSKPTAAAAATRRPSGSRPRGTTVQQPVQPRSQPAQPVLKESAEPIIPSTAADKDSRRNSIDSKRLRDLATPKDIRRRSSTATNDPVTEAIKLTRGSSFTIAKRDSNNGSNSRPPSVSASMKAATRRALSSSGAEAAGITTGVLAGRARSAPRKSVLLTSST